MKFIVHASRDCEPSEAASHSAHLIRLLEAHGYRVVRVDVPESPSENPLALEPYSPEVEG